jgi:hypothetical protein
VGAIAAAIVQLALVDFDGAVYPSYKCISRQETDSASKQRVHCACQEAVGQEKCT